MNLLALLLVSQTLASNWAVLVSTSSSWYDYRHSSNVLAMYEQALEMGIPESNIILLEAGQHQCNPRNLYPGQQRLSESKSVAPRKAHYAGRQVTKRALHSVLTGRGPKTLRSDEDSTILLFLTGHGGDGVLGFEDGPLEVEYLDRILKEMWALNLYKTLLLVVDSCQSATMLEVSAPNVLGVAGAERGKPSWSQRRERAMGISLVDEFSMATARVLAALGSSFSRDELLAGYGALGVSVWASGEGRRTASLGSAQGSAQGSPQFSFSPTPPILT